MKKYLNLSLACLLIFGFLATQAYDGEMAWIIDPQTGTSEEMPDDQAGYFKRDTYISYAYKGKEKIEDTEYLVMEQSFEDGSTTTMYLDPKTYLPYKIKAMSLDQMMMETEEETIMSDYRAVDGVMTAHYFQSIPYLLTTGIPCSSSQTME